jgi:hypothetical protein
MKGIFCRCFWLWSFPSTWPGCCSNQNGKFVFFLNLVGGTPIELCGKTSGVPKSLFQTYVHGGARKTLETIFGRCKRKPASSQDLQEQLVVEQLLGPKKFFLNLPQNLPKQTLGAANPSRASFSQRIFQEQSTMENSKKFLSTYVVANTTAGPTLPAFFFSFLLFFASLLLARLEVLFIPSALLRNY